MEKSIPIKTTSKTFYRQYLEILNPLIKLRKRELDVLASLLRYNNQLLKVPEEHRWKIIFEYDTKTEIRTDLNLSEAGMNNMLSALRKKKIIKNNRVAKWLLIYPGEECKISFKFSIDEPNT